MPERCVIEGCKEPQREVGPPLCQCDTLGWVDSPEMARYEAALNRTETAKTLAAIWRCALADFVTRRALEARHG